jgi:phytoene dehydrogenase-like protein
MYDAVIVGSGPNGLAAAITIAGTGRSVVVLEGAPTAGGGTRTAELTLPGVKHDVCSAVHPLGIASPFFRRVPLSEHGLEWIDPPVPLAHPLDDGTAVLLARDLDETAHCLGGSDAGAYRRVMAPLVEDAPELLADTLGPIRVPRSPMLLARFARHGLRPAAGFAVGVFAGERARALFAGLAAHSILPLDRSPTAAFGLLLGVLGHAVGWPIARGGSQAIPDAMVSYLRSLGGTVECGRPIRTLDELPPSRSVLLDVAPRGLLRLAGDRLGAGHRRRLERFRHGPGVFKLDLALDSPIPWRSADCARAGTVHVGGTFAEIAGAELDVWNGVHPEKPFVLVAQQSLFDRDRAPAGKHTAWAYCHVPNGSAVDMTERIEAQIERFAPGFRAHIVARHALGPAALEEYNPNYVGGDINAGAQDLRQLFTRPALRISPYRTPLRSVYLCSASTPPGGGVHGMCGYFAARSALAVSLRARS